MPEIKSIMEYDGEIEIRLVIPLSLYKRLWKYHMEDDRFKISGLSAAMGFLLCLGLDVEDKERIKRWRRERRLASCQKM